MENEIIKYEDFELIEKVAPVAQLLQEWGKKDNVEECEIESTVVFEVMGKTLWEVYGLSGKMTDWQADIENMIKDKGEDQVSKE